MVSSLRLRLATRSRSGSDSVTTPTHMASARKQNMADNVSSGVEDVDVEEIGSDEEASSDEQEDIEEEATENYNLEEGGEGTEDSDELQPLQLEEEEEEEEGEGEEGEGVEEQELGGEGIDLQGLSEVLRVEVDVLKSLLGVDLRFPHVLNNVVRLLSEKTSLVDQYESTLHQFSENLTSADQTLRELLAF